MTLALPDLRGPPTAGIVGALFVTIVVAGTVLAPLFTPFDPLALGTGTLLPPSLAHPLGTDDLGRDGLARVLYGGRVSLSIGLFSAAISVIVGMTVGMVAGFFGGALDEVLMRITEAFQIVPSFILLLVLVVVFGSDIQTLALVIGAVSWTAPARLTRAEFLSLRGREFVQACRGLGMSDLSIIFREILPNALPPVIVYTSVVMALSILLESALAFLGFSDPDVASWGKLISDGRKVLRTDWTVAFLPGLMILITVLSVSLLGQGINDTLNPRLSRQ